ncbi:MAG: hypothetical protein U1C58_07165 [Flavobacteriaceae bacterium]|nr:hypothetical protein [Flavobacteriaceae bacterium]MDZ4148046.1 hypothetical protein [Flavobacteriaceae bacterium]
MYNTKELNEKQIISINGGTLAWDLGWLIGHSLTSYNGFANSVDAMMDYYLHYNK